MTDVDVDALVAEGATGPAEAARFLGICRSKLYQEMDAGRIPYLKVGTRRLIPKAALRRYLAERLRETQGR